MLSIPTDCPQRDERLGWTGDIAIFSATSTFNVDVHGFLDKFADDLDRRAAQRRRVHRRGAGASRSAGPARPAGATRASSSRTPSGSATATCGVVDEHFAAMARWVDYLKSTSGSDLIRNQPTYGDWLNVNDNTAQDVISTAFFGWSARLVARMAAATGRTGRGVHLRHAGRPGGRRVHQPVRRRRRHGVRQHPDRLRAGARLRAAAGQLVQPAADKLAAKVAATGGHLSVGFLGVENLLPVLAEHGHLDTAYQVLLQPGFPGWGYMLSRGATTIWERWDGIRTDGSFNDPGMNSFNHYGLGSVGDFLYRSKSAAWRRPPPGTRACSSRPRPGGGLTSASAAFATPYGPAVSDWSMSGGVADAAGDGTGRHVGDRPGAGGPSPGAAVRRPAFAGRVPTWLRGARTPSSGGQRSCRPS